MNSLPALLPRWLCAILMFALAALPLSAKDKAAADQTEEKEGKKNPTVVVVTAKLDAVHGAALQALAAIGCEIKKDAPTEIEAKRPNKMGLAVGSGGEKLFVTLKDLGDGKVEVTVRTKKTMVGLVGQKLWNDEVAKQISESVQ